MVAMGSQSNTIKRTVIDGKKVLLLEGPPQVLSWNEFKSICKLFDDIEWFDIADVTGADLTCRLQVKESSHKLKAVAVEFNLSKETMACLSASGIATLEELRELSQDDVSHLKVPMGQKMKVTNAVSRLLKEDGRTPAPFAGSFRTKSASGKLNSNIDGALAEHPKFWADHMSNSKLIKLL